VFYLFEEKNEEKIISAIDDEALNDEIMLNICDMDKCYSSKEIKESFDSYRSKIPKTKRIVT